HTSRLAFLPFVLVAQATRRLAFEDVPPCPSKVGDPQVRLRLPHLLPNLALPRLQFLAGEVPARQRPGRHPFFPCFFGRKRRVAPPEEPADLVGLEMMRH